MNEKNDSVCSSCSSKIEKSVKCERCKKNFCTNCLTSSALLYSHPNGQGLYNICSHCDSIIKEITNFISTQELSWAKLSLKGSEWLSSPILQNWCIGQNLSISSYSSVSISKADESIIDKDVSTGRSDPSAFNWDIKETLLRLEISTYRQDLITLLKAFCAKNRRVGYCQGMSYIAAWLLIFLDIEKAFVIFCFLIESCLPADMFLGSNRGSALNGFYVESTVIASLLEHSDPNMKRLTMSTNEFTDFFAMQHLVQLFINTIDMQSTVFIWDQLFIEGSVCLVKAIICLVMFSAEFIQKEMHPLMIIKELQNLQFSVFLKENYIRLANQVTPARVQRLRIKARNYRSQEWIECKNIVIRRMENMSGFSPEEIQELQIKFKEMMNKLTNIEPERRRVSRRRSTVELPIEILAKMEDYRGSQACGIKKEEFIQLLNDISPNMAEYGEVVFDTFDDDKTGYLDFKELVIALSSISKGNFEDKLQICFNAYDSEKCGYLDSIEVQLLIERILEPFAIAADKNPQEIDIYKKIVHIHQKMMDLSEKSNGQLSYFDLFNGIKADQFLYNCFNEFFGIEFSSQYSKIYTALSMRTGTESKIQNYGESKCRNCFIL